MQKSWFIKGINFFLSKVFVLLIRFYQVCISPFFPKSCRYIPSCSQYAIEAIQEYGPFKGTFLATKRILRCNPYHKGGYDPVPKKQFIGNIDGKENNSCSCSFSSSFSRIRTYSKSCNYTKTN